MCLFVYVGVCCVCMYVCLYLCIYVCMCVCVCAESVTGVRPSVRDLLSSLEYGPAPESPAVVEAWLDDHGRSFGHFIGNQWVKPEGRKMYDSFNPATGSLLASTVQGSGMEELAQLFKLFHCSYKFYANWGVQSRCHVIYIGLSMGNHTKSTYVKKCVGKITWPKHAHAQSLFLAVKT